MRLRNLLVPFLFLGIFFTAYSQKVPGIQPRDSIHMKIYLGPVFKYGAEHMSRKEITNIMAASDSIAYNLMLESNREHESVVATGLLGGAIVGYFVGRTIGQTSQGYTLDGATYMITKPEWFIFASGTGLVVTSFILSSKRNKLAREAIDHYNRNMSLTSGLRLQWLGTGARLVFQF